MRITLSPFIIKLANNAAKIPGLKKILKPWYYKYKERINNILTRKLENKL